LHVHGRSLCFFFQAEEGIRDFHVTGVQTCALPIYNKEAMLEILKNLQYNVVQEGHKRRKTFIYDNIRFDLDKWDQNTYPYEYMEIGRGRVGKECRSREMADHKKQNKNKEYIESSEQ